MIISVCMIVKNEAELLPRALGNLGDLWDELIIVDTGSTDATVDIAADLGATVLHYDWQAPGHKGEARNVGIEAAHGEWIVILDADEQIDNPAVLRAAMLNSDADALSVLFANLDGEGRSTLIWRQIRCFRRGAFVYRYREHEIPVSDRAVTIDEPVNVAFLHMPPPERTAPKVDTMLARLALDVAENPGDTHPHYFYARQLCLAGRFHEAITAHEIYLGMSDPAYVDVCEAYGNLSSCYHALGDHETALTWLYRAVAAQPKRRTWWVRLAEIYIHINEVNLAASILECAGSLWGQGFEPNHDPRYYNGYIGELMQQCQGRLAQSWEAHGREAFDHGAHS